VAGRSVAIMHATVGNLTRIIVKSILIKKKHLYITINYTKTKKKKEKIHIINF